MERIVDIVLVFAACAVASVMVGAFDGGAVGAVVDAAGTVVGTAGVSSSLPFGDVAGSAPAIACLLVAVIVVLGCEWARSTWSLLGPVVFCVLSAFVPEGLLLMPAAVYELCRFVRGPLPWRAAPLATLVPFACAVVARHVPIGTIVLSAVLCVLAALVSVRTSALLAQRDLRHRARDEYRKRELIGTGARSDEDRAARDLVAFGVAHDCAEAGTAPRSGEVPASGAVTRSAPGPAASALVVPLDPPVVSPEERCRATFSQITDREYEVVLLIAEGLDNHEIAAAAFISEGTVRNRISSVLQKTGYANRTQLAVAWWQARVIR